VQASVRSDVATIEVLLRAHENLEFEVACNELALTDLCTSVTMWIKTALKIILT